MSFDIIGNLATGLGAAASLQNLGFAFVGVLLGTLIGVLPGIGTIPTVAMLIPITFGMDPLTALIMLAGIYYGAQYGGSTTSILVNIPGEASSIVTCIDGHQMARNGRAGAALSVAALGSFFAGCVATLFIAAFGPMLASLTLHFNSPENFALLLLGLTMAVVLAHGSVVKAIAMVILGMLIGLVGSDVNSGSLRFTFGVEALWDGIGFLPLVIGMYGVTEILRNLDQPTRQITHLSTRFRELYPSKSEFKAAWPAVIRGTLVGSLLGVLPGGGAVLSSFASYTLEKKIAKDPSRFGRGAIEGVAGPESANNAGAQTSFIPLLTLGLPSNPIMALMMGAMLIQGIAPGTAVMTARPELFWGMVASMWIGNAMLVILNLPLIGIWVKLLSIPYRFLYPAILLFCVFGVYSVDNNTIQMSLMVVFALFGFLLIKLNCEPAPMVLGFILGPLMEENFRRSLVMSRGNPTIFLERPISAVLLVATLGVIALILVPQLRKTREVAFAEAD